MRYFSVSNGLNTNINNNWKSDNDSKKDLKTMKRSK